MEEHNKSKVILPSTKFVPLSFKIQSGIHSSIMKYCKDNDITFNSLMCKLLVDNYLPDTVTSVLSEEDLKKIVDRIKQKFYEFDDEKDGMYLYVTSLRNRFSYKSNYEIIIREFIDSLWSDAEMSVVVKRQLQKVLVIKQRYMNDLLDIALNDTEINARLNSSEMKHYNKIGQNQIVEINMKKKNVEEVIIESLNEVLNGTLEDYKETSEELDEIVTANPANSLSSMVGLLDDITLDYGATAAEIKDELMYRAGRDLMDNGLNKDQASELIDKVLEVLLRNDGSGNRLKDFNALLEKYSE